MAFVKNSNFRVSGMEADFLTGSVSTGEGEEEEENEVQMRSEVFDTDSDNDDEDESEDESESEEDGDGDDVGGDDAEDEDEDGAGVVGDVDDDLDSSSGIDSGMESDELDPADLGEPGTELCQVGNQSFCIPLELYDLDSLGSVLSLETWNECLSEEERFKLAEFLPDMDQETFGRTLAELFTGSNFHFGSPLVTLFKQLKGGLCDPRVTLHRRGLKLLQHREHCHQVHSYYSGMLKSLAWIGSAWQNCAGYDIEEKIQTINMWRSQMPLDHRKVGDIGSETDLESGDSSRYWSKQFKADRLSAKPSHDIMHHNSKGFLKVNAPKLPMKDFTGKSGRYPSSFQHTGDLKRKIETPVFPFSGREHVPQYDVGAGAINTRHPTIADLNDTVNRYEMSPGEWIPGQGNGIPRNSLSNKKRKKPQHKYDRDVEDSEQTEGYAASSYHQGKIKFADKGVSVAAYNKTSLSSSKKPKYPKNYGTYHGKESVQKSSMRGTLFQHSSGSQSMKRSEMHQDVSLPIHSIKSGDGHGKGKKWRSQCDLKPGKNSAGYDTKIKTQKASVGVDDSYFQMDMQPRMTQKKLKSKSIEYDLAGTDYLQGNNMYAHSEETESDSSDQNKNEDASHVRKLGHHRGVQEFEPNKANKARKMYRNDYSYYPDGGTNLNSSKVEAYSTKSKKKGKKNESNYLLDNMADKGSGSYANVNLHNASSGAYMEKKRRAIMDLDQCPEELYAQDYNYNDSLLDDYTENVERGPKLLSSRAHSNRMRSIIEASDAQAVKVGHEMPSMPLIGCNSMSKKSKWKVDGQYPDESMYQNQQFDDPHTVKKKGKKKSDVGLDALAAVVSDSFVPEKGIADVESDLKPQRKPFTLITPTIHTGFSFSIVHLLTAVRKAMITSNMDDIAATASHLDKTGEPKKKTADTETHQTVHIAHLSKPLDLDNDAEASKNNFPSRTVQEIVDRVRSNPGDPYILETQEPLQDLVRGTLKIFSSRTAPLGAKGWKPLVVYEGSNKSWSWVGPASTSSPENDIADEENSPEAWGIPHKMLVKMVDAFANWLKSGQDTLKQIGSLPAPPSSLFTNLDEKERFKDLKAQKSLNTIAPSTDEVRAYFRKEELLRYSIPDRAFSYTAADGKKSIVAPLRRGGGKPTSKARDHFMLKPDRPPHVTILCLVRDAAARLPGSIGTRADVCTLIRDSQYIVETVTDAQVNQVVSGALDRLHYERDPCVQFDAEKKIWKYLHRDREEEDFEDDGTSSTKKWKRQRKDATDQSDAGALNDDSHVIGGGDTAANGSSAGLDDEHEHDLNIDASSSKADEETGQFIDRRKLDAEDVAPLVDRSRDGRSHWGALD